MPLAKSRLSRPLLLILLLLLGAGFLVTTLLSYQTSRATLRNNIVNTELPLTSDTVYSEIQKDLIRPILISSMMARDTFVRDWVLAGEQDVGQMTRYLAEIMEQYGAYTAFFVSDRSQVYYQARGVLKKVDPAAERDVWYFRVRDMAEPYEINADLDMANEDRLTFFINYKVFDYQGNFIGATGVGLSIEAAVALIDRYQARYARTVFFADRSGQVTLTGRQSGELGLTRGHSLSEMPAFAALLDRLPSHDSETFEYEADGYSHFLNVRYIPELDWYLFVDKHEGRLFEDIRQALHVNLLVCLMVVALVMTLVGLVLRRHQRHIAELATTDVLTELPNRRGFELLSGQALQEARREQSPLCALLIDLDHFKQLNDSHGHLAGDEVLRRFAADLRQGLRKTDIICRWGGEEFVVLFKNTDLPGARRLAEKLRERAEAARYRFDGKDLTLTVSLGLTRLRADESLHDLLGRTDRALYRAKQSGRNRVCAED